MKIWCLLRDQFAHVQPVETAMRGHAEFVYDAKWNPAELIEAKPDLVLCVNDYPYDVARCIDSARAAGIPSLVLQDGILEWRCQYENPLFGAGGGAPQHQPVLADKIACIGHQSARQIAAWGNAEKVEVTGMPRLDFLFKRKLPEPARPGRRLLVMTAKNPGFTPEQRKRTIASLQELKAYVCAQPGLELLWRVSKGVARELGVENQLQQASSVELVSVLENADAVISTLSTAMLEAMCVGRPVAALDYHNVPRFVPTAWTISAGCQIGPVVQELLEPTPAKMKFQQDCLSDCLECDGKAAQRVAALIELMVQHARKAKSCPVAWPSDLLKRLHSFQFFQRPSLQELYPGQSSFETGKLEDLQIRLARAASENARLNKENQELRANTNFGSWITNKITGISKR